MKVVTSFVFLYACINQGYLQSLPSYVKVCKRTDPKFSDCFRESFAALGPKLVNDLPEMGLKKIDPVEIDEVEMTMASSNSLNLHIVMRNMRIHGLSQMIFEKVDFKISDDSSKIYLDTVTYLKKLRLMADYTAEGRILLLNLNANGKYDGNYTEGRFQILWAADIVTKDGKQYAKLNDDTSVVMNLDPKKTHVYMSNLIAGQPEMTDSMNDVMNENMDVIYAETKPFIEKVIASLVVNRTQSVYDKFPLDVLYPT